MAATFTMEMSIALVVLCAALYTCMYSISRTKKVMPRTTANPAYLSHFPLHDSFRRFSDVYSLT